MPEMDEAILKRVLPHSIEAEQSVIGAVLMVKKLLLLQANRLIPMISMESSTESFLIRW